MCLLTCKCVIHCAYTCYTGQTPLYNAVQYSSMTSVYKPPVTCSCRLHGDEGHWGDAADVWSVLHPEVVWRRPAVLDRVLRVRQDHAQGQEAVLS